MHAPAIQTPMNQSKDEKASTDMAAKTNTLSSTSPSLSSPSKQGEAAVSSSDPVGVEKPGQIRRMWDTVSKLGYTPKRCRWDPDQPPEFGLGLNLVFSFVCAPFFFSLLSSELGAIGVVKHNKVIERKQGRAWEHHVEKEGNKMSRSIACCKRCSEVGNQEREIILCGQVLGTGIRIVSWL